ncbi:spirocyclase AveC family protein [Streptomyces sp. MNP-20]|uniref:spirocyclase AveC family protein n=1 Tax=Streptomyces sp. MNP-20 TaxID=2721165 RepID=UPI0015571B87|nr:spirocyclase AveC family protein [Streptomyces sp. MNP-20]
MSSTQPHRTGGSAMDHSGRVSALRRSPVVAWAAVGAAFLAAGAVVMGRWTAAGGFRISFGDRASLSTGREIVVWSVQTVIALTFAAILGYVIGQCRREKHITFDAALLAAYTTTIWTDPLLGYHSPRAVLYDAALVHTPSWGPYLPGWQGGSHQITPFAGSWLGYVLGAGWLIATALLMRPVLRRRPALSGWRLGVAVAAASTAAGLVLEMGCVQGGIYAYPGTFPLLTVFPGQWYQLSLPQVALTAFCWGGIPFLLRHRHLKHGADTPLLRGLTLLPTGARSTAQALAVIGAVGTTILVWHAGIRLCTLASATAPINISPYPFV